MCGIDSEKNKVNGFVNAKRLDEYILGMSAWGANKGNLMLAIRPDEIDKLKEKGEIVVCSSDGNGHLLIVSNSFSPEDLNRPGSKKRQIQTEIEKLKDQIKVLERKAEEL